MELYRQSKQPAKREVIELTKVLKAGIFEYWFGWETCFKDFQRNPERQMIYHNEFTKLYQPCDFETFKNETKRLINRN
jgi:hypothetical protein